LISNNLLDDISKIEKTDNDKMYVALENSHHQLQQSYIHQKNVLSRFNNKNKSNFSNIIFAGMGASGLAAEIVSDWLSNKINLPITTIKDPKLPNYINENTLFLPVSKSGETMEVLKAVNDASKITQNIISLSIHGQLEKFSKSNDFIHLNIDHNPYSRTSTLALIGSLIAILDTFLDIESSENLITKTNHDLNNTQKDLSINNPFSNNISKQSAKFIFEKNKEKSDIYVLSSQKLKTIGLRLVQQFNENSKISCFYSQVPDALHNTIVALAASNSGTLITIQSKNDPKYIYSAFNEITQVAQNQNLRIINISGNSDSILTEMLTTLLQVDYLSYYVSILNTVSPGPTIILDSLKEKLKHTFT
jgi:glucose/mannose-6-phosphate isomerase